MKFSTALALSTILASSAIVLARPTGDEPIQGVSALKTIRATSNAAKTTTHTTHTKTKAELEKEKAKELEKKLGNGQKLKNIRTRRSEDTKTDAEKTEEILKKLGRGGLLSQKLKGTN